MSAMYDHTTTIATLKSAVPYIRLYRNKVFVVKVGGSAFEGEHALLELVEQLGTLSELGIRIVLVHGGGTQTTELASRLGLKTQMINGRRVTDEQTLEAAIMTLNGTAQTRILAACLAKGLQSVGLSGVDAGLIRATRRPVREVEVNGDRIGVDYGLVGDVLQVNVGILNTLLDAGYLPVVSPLSSDEKGQVLNINADTVAAAIAAELNAEKLIFVTSVAGVLQKLGDPGSLVSYTDLRGLKWLEDSGAIDTGMRPKIAAARQALLCGVRRVHIIGSQRPSSLLVEVFTNEGAGTLIVKDSCELLPFEKNIPKAEHL